MKANFQPGIHPDADQLSVFLEGAASSHEHERMLAHLAECAECRKAVFLMQPQKETQAPRPEPIPGWTWRRLLPAAVLIPAALGWVRWLAQRTGLVGDVTGPSLVVLVNIVIFTALIWWTAGRNDNMLYTCSEQIMLDKTIVVA